MGGKKLERRPSDVACELENAEWAGFMDCEHSPWAPGQPGMRSSESRCGAPQQVFPKESFSLCSPAPRSIGAQMSGTGTLGEGVKSTQMFSERKLLRLKNPRYVSGKLVSEN